jgi:hypothetical protein
MSQGIALSFRRKFGKIEELKSQQKQITEIAYLKSDNQFIFYLITKDKLWQKPTYENLFKTLVKLKELAEENRLTEIAISKIGYGLDQLESDQVRTMLRYIFRNSSIKIIAFCRDNLKDEEKLKIISEHHDTPFVGHQGVEKTYSRLKT